MDRENRLKREWQREDDEQISAAIEALLKHAHGRRFLWWLLEVGRIGLQPYARNALDTSFNCGELNVGQRILDRIITVSPQGYVNMMEERQDVERTRSEALDRGDNPESDGGTDSTDD